MSSKIVGNTFFAARFPSFAVKTGYARSFVCTRSPGVACRSPVARQNGLLTSTVSIRVAAPSFRFSKPFEDRSAPLTSQVTGRKLADLPQHIVVLTQTKRYSWYFGQKRILDGAKGASR